MTKRLCAACEKSFKPHPQVPGQIYCSSAACQRDRRRRWQLAKRRNDPDYRDNQARANQAWLESRPDYWREYRGSNPEYADRNRANQSDRNRRRRQPLIAKMDESTSFSPVISGTYKLQRLVNGVAKMDEWTVKILLVSTPKPKKG